MDGTPDRSSYTACSLNFVFLSKNSRKFATSYSPALGCHWLKKKNSQEAWLYTHIALRAKQVSYSDAGEGGLLWIVKKYNFSWTTCSWQNYFFNSRLTNPQLEKEGIDDPDTVAKREAVVGYYAFDLKETNNWI